MVTIDKLDKLGMDGVTAELGEKFGQSVADASFEWLSKLDQSRFPAILQPLVDAMGPLALKDSIRREPGAGDGLLHGSNF